jgi:hypothetical protein
VRCASRYLDVWMRQQVFIGSGQHIMTQIDEDWLEVPGEVLIEFELHVLTAIFHTLSWANSAA